MNQKGKLYILIILISFMLFIGGSLIAQSHRQSIVEGQISLGIEKQLRIGSQKVSVDKNGKFVFPVTIDHPQYLTFNYGESFDIYIKPEDRMTIKVDIKNNLNPVAFTGDSSLINNFLTGERVQNQKFEAFFRKALQSLIELKEPEFLLEIDKLWLPARQRLDQFVNIQKINDIYFIKTQHVNWQYSKTIAIFRYPLWKQYRKISETFEPLECYTQLVQTLDLNDRELWELEDYRDALKQYLGYNSTILKQSGKFKGRNYPLVRAQMEAVLKSFSDPLIKNEMLFSFMHDFFNWGYLKGTDDIVETYFKNATNPEHIKTFKKMIEEDANLRKNVIIKTFKIVNGVDLDVYIYLPPDNKKGDRRPALVFFHGGGWEVGRPGWGDRRCRHFAKLGMVGFSFEYRLIGQHGTTPVECVMDAKSAIRWLRKNSEEYGVDPARIAVSGYSAGGHLAACVTMSDWCDQPGEDLSINSAANASIFQVTPFKISEESWFANAVRLSKAQTHSIDPTSLIRKGLPPSIIFQGDKDHMVNFRPTIEFADKMKSVGNRCELHLYKGQGHFGWGSNNDDVYQKTEEFLRSLGYIK